ncbi:hypothetical protein H7F51_03710 [Novosphingobium flavum]|uniref:Hpr(Ser) kinase/phosphatase n=1 Tax=Novosphingobium flavum TaxID=1778672 RepID=A0A7X1FPL4_9SPHN|nr:hypothetical protein [Novosphingobium flavum]MBC2664623.1 hypothetical protein [Novosphingobium flavum]
MIDLMAREMRLRPGPVPAALGGSSVAVGKHLLRGDEFVLREPGLAFHYRKGEGVTVERQPGPADPDEEELFLNGSVYAAVAAINGLMPLHASAVAVGGKVAAFTGPAGAGKSTLVAGLSRLGLLLFCDDTLLLHFGQDGAITCLPGHKRMKLWRDAAELTESEPLERVSAAYPKVYVTPAGGDVAEPLPLGALVFLEEGAGGEAPCLLPLGGGEKIARLDDDHYTRALFDAASGHGRAERFALHARIARQAAMARFVRPKDRGGFWAATRYLAENISDMVG